MYSRKGRAVGSATPRPHRAASYNLNSSRNTTANERPSSSAWWNVQRMRHSSSGSRATNRRIIGARERSKSQRRSAARCASKRCPAVTGSRSCQSTTVEVISASASTSWHGSRDVLPAEPRAKDRMTLHDVAPGTLESLEIQRFVQGDDDLFDIDACCVLADGVKQHALLHRRQLVAIDHVIHASSSCSPYAPTRCRGLVISANSTRETKFSPVVTLLVFVRVHEGCKEGLGHRILRACAGL